jgi:hypothetical protein
MSPNSLPPTNLETHDLVSALAEQVGARRVPLSGLIALGRGIYKTAIAPSTSDADALARVEEMIRPALALRPDRPSVPEQLDEIDHADIAGGMWVGKWCASGFPRVRLRAARAALFAATAIPGEVVAEVRLPNEGPGWPRRYCRRAIPFFYGLSVCHERDGDRHSSFSSSPKILD